MTDSIVYGPVPSRRLGLSLGINNIPPKRCSYSCIYCQVGYTTRQQIERETFYDPAEIVSQVGTRLAAAAKNGEHIDYLAFVPDGEPVLDANLGIEIERLRPLGIPVAVITNSSLLWREDVRRDLMKADWVSIKVDAVTPAVWHDINKPVRNLSLPAVLGGIEKFAASFEGILATETMLVRGVNDSIEEIRKVADFLSKLRPSTAWISIPTRPPARSILPAREDTVIAAYEIFQELISSVECLIGYEGNAFAGTGNPREDILSITSVHPMREDAMAAFLQKTGGTHDIVTRLIDEGKLLYLEFQGKKFYQRKFAGCSKESRLIDVHGIIKNSGTETEVRLQEESPFESQAEQYDAWFDADGSIVFATELMALRPLLPALPKPWLEIGVGTGRFAAELGIETGIEPSESCRKIAAGRGIDVHPGKGEQHIFNAGSFGAVFILTTLCFVDSPRDVLKEAARILVPGGKLVLGIILKESEWGQWYHRQKQAGHRFYRFATIYDYTQTRDMLQQAGFSIENIVSTLFQPPEKVSRIEDPVPGYSPEAGFTVILAGLASDHTTTPGEKL